MDMQMKSKSPDGLLARMRRLFKHIEGGSMDGGNYSDIVYAPMLLALLLFGLMVALVGFYRVGASYAAQGSAQLAAVAPDQADPALQNAWSGWTQGNAPTNGVTVDSASRTVSANIDTSKSYNMGVLGNYQFQISAGSGIHVRSERFYPGQPVCTDTGCNE